MTITMTKFLLHLVSSLLLLSLSKHAQAKVELVLSDRVMELTNYSAYLSALVYEAKPPREADMEKLEVYLEEPDQALVVQAHGYCFGVFRGTTLTTKDWAQNLKIGNAQVCDDYSEETTCCTTRVGFFHAYNAVYKDKVEEDLKECAKTCEYKDECVVLTGHSQGGAIAAVAGVALASLNPYVITFGQPPTIMAPCERIQSERWYRWINTKLAESVAGVSYDPVPFVPGLGANYFGHMIILAEDNTGVAYVGLDSQDIFSPLNVAGFEAHSMISTTDTPGYLDRIQAIMKVYEETGTYPVRTNGFMAGSHCTQNVECETGQCGRETGFSWKRCVGAECLEDAACDTNRCDSGLCLPKLGSCHVCDENSDCESGVCSWRFRCAEDVSGLMGDQCLCNFDRDCKSGRCEGWHAKSICEPKLPDGASCDESSDCLSGKCSWRFRCVPGASVIALGSIVAAIAAPATGDSEEKEGTTRTIQVIVAVTFLLVFVIGVTIHCCVSKRRRGYEEIPTRLNV